MKIHEIMMLFSEYNLLQKINELSSIKIFSSEMNVETNIIINWVNKLYSFLIEKNYMIFFNQTK